MMIELIHTLYRYNAWANTRILDATARLTSQQLLTSGSASFGSVRDTLVHAMGAQWLWLSRWQGISPTALPDTSDFPDLDAIRLRWVRSKATRRPSSPVWMRSNSLSR